MSTPTQCLFCILAFSFFYCVEITAQCGVNADAGPDQVVCNAGETVVLGGNFSGMAFGFSWSPPLGLSDPNSLTPSVTVNNNFTYTLTVQGPSTSNPNLIVNGDFESGPAGFTSDYTFVSPGNPFALASPGTYTITTSPSLVLNTFPPCDDHTYGDGSGNMMIVNGGSSPGTRVWCQTVNVNPNTYYVFEAFISPVHQFVPGTIQLSINGNNIGNQLNLPAAFCSWTGMNELWFSGASTSATICLLDMNGGGGFLANDYMLDDISLIEACESTDEVEVSILTAEAVVSAPFATIPCEGDCILLDASASTSGVSFLWTSSGGGVIQSGANSDMPEVCAGGDYTLVVSNSLNGVSCSSDPLTVTVNVLEAVPDIPVIGGLDEACNGASEIYNILAAGAGINYNWSISGGQIVSGQGSGQISVEWLSEGNATLCATGENTCGLSDESCFIVDVTGGFSSSLDTFICEGDSILLNGTYYGSNNPGGTESYTAANGCDSTVSIQVTERPDRKFDYQRVICEGDSALINGVYEFNSGTFVESFTDRHGCDSIITTQLDVITYDINDPPPVVCASQACTGLVDAGPDITLCSPVSPVQLNGVVQGTPVFTLWTPASGLNNPSILNPTATVTSTTTYTLSATVRSNNLVTNGDFENGPTGFSTDYVIGTSSCYGLGFLDCEGTYGVLGNPMDGHSSFSACSDAVGGGNMMVVNGAAAFQNVWCQTINVVPGTDYDFSAWVTSVNPASPAILQFSINGNTIGPLFNAGAPCAWAQFSASWNSGGNNSATICILNQNTATGGNDFALDGISFSEVCQVMDEVTIYVLDLTADIAMPNEIDCNDPNSCVFLDATNTFTNGNSLTYQWAASAGGTIQSGGNTPNPLVCSSGTYTLTASAELNGMICTKTASVNVFNNMASPPDPIILGPELICGDSTFTYTAQNDFSYTNFEWQLLSGGTIQFGQGTSEIIVDWDNPDSVQLCLLVSNQCMEIAYNCITVDLSDTLAAPVLEGSDQICSKDSLQSYSVQILDTMANSLVWSVPGGAIIESGQGTDTVSVNWSNTGGGQICLQLNGDCDTIQECLTVLVVAEQSASFDTLICPGTTFLYNGTLYGNGNFNGQELLLSQTGCDSLVAVMVAETIADTTELLASSCDPNDVGTTQSLLTNSDGCDSLVITMTSFLASDTTELLASSCDPNDVGTTQSLLTNSDGCDSLVITMTSFLASDTTELLASSCDPNDVGTTQSLLTNSDGCDSLVITMTSFLASDTTELLASSCDPNDVGTTQSLLTNSDGCDSLVITMTSFLASDTTELLASSCDPNDEGTTQSLLTNSDGCDSLVITMTSFLASDTTELLASSCDPNDVGTTQSLLTNSDGCDSLVITMTSFLASDTTELLASSCDPNDVGTTQSLLTNSDGCDSLVITMTSFLASDTTELLASSCDPNDVGTTQSLLTNSDGCDSLVITMTSFLASDTTELQASSCDPNDVGTTQSLLTNSDGCDSLVITMTSFLASDTTELLASSCDPNNVGTTQSLLTNSDGCDSLVITMTSFLASDTTELLASSCDPNDVGTTQSLLTNSDGCDSLVITMTSFLASDTTELLASSCDPNDEGTVQSLLTNSDGCDSLVITMTSFLASDTTELLASSCDPNDVGTTQSLLTNSDGCDSLIITMTSFLASDTTELIASSCDPNDVGTTQSLLTNSDGCDSLVITMTSFLASDTTELLASSCDPNDVGTTQSLLTNSDGCDSLVITMTSFLASDTTELLASSCDPNDEGTVQSLLTNSDGCDSLVITMTSFLASDTTELLASSCDPNDEGTVQSLLTNSDGCDSLVITMTTFLASDTTELLASSCDPNDVGTTQSLLTNSDGCDSLVITMTSFLASDTTELQASSCDPNDVGTTQSLLTNSDGCDSLVITMTSFLASDTTELLASSCDPNDVGTTQSLLTNSDGCDSLVITMTSFLASDTTELLGSSCDPNDVGTTQSLLTNSDGCDSLIITMTSFLASDTTELLASSCDPNDVGTTQSLLTNSDGCDSLVITTTNLLASDTTDIFQTSCDPDLVGMEVMNFLNSDGCDSLVRINTSLLPPDSCGLEAVILADTISCNETQASLTIEVTLGQGPFIYSWSGPGTNPLGQGVISGLYQQEVIPGLEEGDYRVTITSGGGYALILDVAIVREPKVEISVEVLSDYNGEALSCFGASDGMAAVSLVSAGTLPLEYTWSNGQQGSMAEGLGSGWHTVSLIDAKGCMDVDSVFLSAPEPLLLVPAISEVLCFGDNDGVISLENVEGGTLPYLYSLNGGPFQIQNSFFNLSAGSYDLAVVDANGCMVDERILINMPFPLLVGLGRDTTIQLGDSIHLRAVTNIDLNLIDSLIWTNAACNGCMELTVAPVITTSYSVILIDDNGCRATDEVTIGVEKVRNVYIPNIFSPNGDGINDRFMIFADRGIRKVNDFQIYSRWGEKVFSAKDFQPNDPDYGWDGWFRGEPLNPAVFVYWALIEFEDGELELYEGDVVLVK